MDVYDELDHTKYRVQDAESLQFIRLKRLPRATYVPRIDLRHNVNEQGWNFLEIAHISELYGSQNDDGSIMDVVFVW